MKSKKEMLEDIEGQIWDEGVDYFSSHKQEYDDIVAELEHRYHLGMIDDFVIDRGDEMTYINDYHLQANLLFQAIITTAVEQAVYHDRPDLGRTVKDKFFTAMCLRGGSDLLDTLGISATK